RGGPFSTSYFTSIANPPAGAQPRSMATGEALPSWRASRSRVTTRCSSGTMSRCGGELRQTRPSAVTSRRVCRGGMHTLVAQVPVALLFTDLVHSTELLHRVGDEQAQRVLGAHRQLLRNALAGHGGGEVKWLGDGLMTIFPSVADAVRCAVTMQQQARRPTA